MKKLPPRSMIWVCIGLLWLAAVLYTWPPPRPLKACGMRMMTAHTIEDAMCMR